MIWLCVPQHYEQSGGYEPLRARNDITGLHDREALGEGWEWALFESLSGHINGGGYNLGYYVYLM
jgi:hypothetical protein